MSLDRTAREPSRVTDTVRATLYQAGDLMAYEASAHDEHVLAEGTPDEIIAWCKGHPARVQLALDGERARGDDARPGLVYLLETVADFVAPAVQAAQRTDAAFNAPPEE